MKNKTTAVAVESKEAMKLEKSVAPVLVKSERILAITTEKEMEIATEMLSQLNQYADGFKAEKKKLETPAKATIAAIKAFFSPIEDRVLPQIEKLRELMGAYQTEKVRLAREEEAKISARVGEGKGKLKMETAVAKIDEIDKPVEKIATTSGALRFREDKKLKIMDETMIPRDYLIPDREKILNALKGGMDVAGCEIELVQVPINTR